jgi:ABC-2 type transport system permease protein
LEYRFDFVANVLRGLGWIIVSLISFSVIFAQSPTISGWNKHEAFVLFGMYVCLNEMWWMFFSLNLQEIPKKIQSGQLDYELLLPISFQFLTSLRQFLPYSLPNLLVGIGIVIQNMYYSGHSISIVQFFLTILLVINALIILYSVMLALVTISFWIIQFSSFWDLYGVLTEGARYPVNFYKEPLHFIFLFVIPLGIIFTFPAQFLAKGLSWELVVVSFVVGIVASILSHKFFYFGVRNYNSASS